MMLTLMLTSKGVAGVPRASLVVLAATLAQFDLPLEGAAILLGIDQIMDMGRTAVNVMGNCMATAVVARWEGVLDDERDARVRRRHHLAGRLMRVVVTGAGGQLGAAIVHECAGVHEVIGVHPRRPRRRRRCGGCCGDRPGAPRLIVNGAAFTNVDAAEDQPLEALRVNAFAVRALARAARAHGATLVHYSTDFVFDGTASQPYTESDRPNPLSTYAASKLLGEWFALDAPRAYVLRVESLFGRTPGGPSRAAASPGS